MLLGAQNSLYRASKTRERRCCIEKNKRRFMLWFFHNRVFPPTWEQNGGPSNHDFSFPLEQENHFKSSPFDLPKSIIPDVYLNWNRRINNRFDWDMQSPPLGKPKLISFPDVILNQAPPPIRVVQWCLNWPKLIIAVDSLVCFMYPDSIWYIFDYFDSY